MNDTVLDDIHLDVATGELCPACGEIMLAARAGEVILGCACGRAAVLV